MTDYRSLINRIEDRYNPELITEARNRTIASLAGIDRDVAKYVKLAMNEVDSLYTQKTLDAGESAKRSLQEGLPYQVDFRYQGSIMTRTHIKGVSDIDLLTITKVFQDTDYTKAKELVDNNPYSYSSDVARVRAWVNNFSRYTGDANGDLRRLRFDDERVLQSRYTICDTSKPKAIRITNQHYHRDVDIVVASWHDSLDYIKGLGDPYRGIYIYDKDNNKRLGPDFPFLSIDRINTRSLYTEGRLKKMIRFLKNVKADSELSIDLSSFDINAICYDINVNEYKDSHYLDLVRVVWLKLFTLCWNETEANDLKSVDGTEYIFRDKPSKMASLRRLRDEVSKIYNEIK